MPESAVALKQYPCALQRFQEHLKEPACDLTAHMETLRKYSHGTVLELGTRKGVSTSALLLGVEEKGGQVWSVDIQDCSKVFAGHPQWHFVKANSLDQKTILEAGLPVPLDLLFVDTAHTYIHTLNELLCWGKFMAEDGAILLHDTDDPMFPFAVRGAMHTYAHMADKPFVYFFPDSFGLGLIRCKSPW